MLLPVEYPDTLTLKQLEVAHPDWLAIAPTLRRIDDLVAGGHQIEMRKGEYLKPRPGEETDLYKLRLEKFTYTNQLGGAIAQQVSKLASGVLTVNGLPENDEFWTAFRENTGAKRDERTLISEVFRCGLKFRHVYLHVEKPYSEVQPQNKAQEEYLGLNPYVCLYSPLEVTNWGEEPTSKQVTWLKVRQIMVDSDPFKPSQIRATWTFIDGEAIAKYTALVKLNKQGKIAEIVDEQGNMIEAGEDAKVAIARPSVKHGVGALPVVQFQLPQDLWVTDQVYLKALEHLRLENSRSDTAEMAGYVQRTWKPHLTPDGDLDATFVDVDEDLKSGNQYIIKGDFGFSEATGSSIATVGELLQEIRDYIQDAIGTARASTTKGALMQSGVSKQMDFVVQELVLRAYGQLLCSCYQDVIQLVGKVAGRSADEVADYSVTGLDSFDIDSLEMMLAIATELATVEVNIPPTALKLFYGQLSNLLVKNTSAEQQAQIQEELEDIFESRKVPEDSDEDDEGDRLPLEPEDLADAPF